MSIITDKHKRIIKQLKENKLYPTYRALVNYYITQNKRGLINVINVPLFKAIAKDEINEIVKYVKFQKAYSKKVGRPTPKAFQNWYLTTP